MKIHEDLRSSLGSLAFTAAFACGLALTCLLSIVMAGGSNDLAETILEEPAVRSDVEDRIVAAAVEQAPRIIGTDLIEKAATAVLRSDRADPLVEDVVAAGIGYHLGRSSGDVEVSLSDFIQLDGVVGMLLDSTDVTFTVPVAEDSMRLRTAVLLVVMGTAFAWAALVSVRTSSLAGSMLAAAAGAITAALLAWLGVGGAAAALLRTLVAAQWPAVLFLAAILLATSLIASAVPARVVGEANLSGDQGSEGHSGLVRRLRK